MKTYLNMLQHILDKGTVKGDRTNTGTIGVFGYQNRYDLSEGFPLLTTKRMFLKGIIYELLWFLNGDTNIKYLVDNNVNIWNAWPLRNYNNQNPKNPLTESQFIDKIKNNPHFAEDWGDCGPVYGHQWRKWPGKVKRATPEFTHSGGGGKSLHGYVDIEYETHDQISQLITDLRNNHTSRRIIVSAWNVRDLKDMEKSGLPPCHCLFQFNVRVIDDKKYLDCQLYQRSADSFLGVPFNIASYALLIMMIAQQVNMIPGDFVHTFGDLHIYSNHVDQVNEQLSREPYPLPKMEIVKAENIFSYKYEDFNLIDYKSHPPISAPIAV